MQNSTHKNRFNLGKHISIIILLVFIFVFVDILTENVLGMTESILSPSRAFFCFLFFGLLQIFFAPIQSALSDIYGRKNSLVVSLFFSLLSLCVIYLFNQTAEVFALLILAIIFKGIFGNTLPISLALIADTRYKNYRLLFSCTTAAYALAYLLVSSIYSDDKLISLKNINFYLIFLFFIVIIVCILFLKTEKLHQFKHVNENQSLLSVIKTEKKMIIADIKNSSTQKALTAFFLWEMSLYTLLLSQVDFHVSRSFHIAEWMMSGYLFGICILVFCYKLKDSTVIKMGYSLSFFSFIPYIIFSNFLENQNILLRLCGFCLAIGNALLCTSFFSILAHELKDSKHGRMYGLTDSVDTLGYISGAIILILFSILQIDIFYLVLCSFIIFSISWKFYNRFTNKQKGLNT